jgi:hypothetical protein
MNIRQFRGFATIQNVAEARICESPRLTGIADGFSGLNRRLPSELAAGFTGISSYITLYA